MAIRLEAIACGRPSLLYRLEAIAGEVEKLLIFEESWDELSKRPNRSGLKPDETKPKGSGCHSLLPKDQICCPKKNMLQV